jgi:hypothetical protein
MLVNESKLRQIISRAIKESYKINESEDDESKIVKAIKKVGKTYEKFKDADASDLTNHQFHTFMMTVKKCQQGWQKRNMEILSRVIYCKILSKTNGQKEKCHIRQIVLTTTKDIQQ